MNCHGDQFQIFRCERLPVDNDGFLDLNELETVLSDYNQKGQHGNKRIRIMAVSGASNVLGSFNNLEEISLYSSQIWGTGCWWMLHN